MAFPSLMGRALCAACVAARRNDGDGYFLPTSGLIASMIYEPPRGPERAAIGRSLLRNQKEENSRGRGLSRDCRRPGLAYSSAYSSRRNWKKRKARLPGSPDDPRREGRERYFKIAQRVAKLPRGAIAEQRVDCTRETIYRVEADKSARVRSTGTRGKFYKLSRVSFSGGKKAPFARSFVRSFVRSFEGKRVGGLLKTGETNEIGKSCREIG